MAGALVDVALVRPSFLGGGQFRSAGGIVQGFNITFLQGFCMIIGVCVWGVYVHLCMSHLCAYFSVYLGLFLFRSQLLEGFIMRGE